MKKTWKKKERLLLWLLCGCLCPAAAQSDAELRHLNPAAMGERLHVNVDVGTELYNMDFERSRKDACLDITVPVKAGGRYMFAGLRAGNTYFNIENNFAAQLRYGIRFTVGGGRSGNLYLTTAVGAGMEYDHIDMARLLENGSDPYVNSLAPNAWRFVGSVGVALHNDRFSVSVFSPRLAQRFFETPVAVGAGWHTDPARKAAFAVCGYGSYTAAGADKGLYGHLRVSGVFFRFMGIDVDYDSRNRLHGGASIHIREAVTLGYQCGFTAFRIRRAGAQFLSHQVRMSILFKRSDRRERDYIDY
ncbi:MAG: hypothetical protein NC048_02725 [Bacteroides sp.]|nr:hypothetical protein [Bacteroides sp.]MCM1531446.1 hypothetical protein [Ruminococcus flavefaciens]MCM1554392.1 hypothetical protein [Bacteroides sp.]